MVFIKLLLVVLMTAIALFLPLQLIFYGFYHFNFVYDLPDKSLIYQKAH
jgi:hypothetical protein